MEKDDGYDRESEGQVQTHEGVELNNTLAE